MNDDTLAIEGGISLLPEGPPGWPRDDERVREALLAAYADGSWGKYDGGHVQALEQRLAQYHGVAHALACSSGTFAVELALRALKIGPCDEVALAAYDFGGNFRAIEAVGATPVLVDVERDSWCLDPNSLDAAFSPALRAVIVSHLHGGIADMQQIVQWSQGHSISVVEDACQIPGGEVQGRRAGGWGDVGVLSFGGSKLLTSGRGGALVTNDARAAQRAKVFCERGNHAFPLSELQAAVLLPQLVALDEQNARRRESIAQLRAATSDLATLIPVKNDARGQPAYYKHAWLYPGSSRERFTVATRAEGVALDAGFRGFVGRSASRCRRVGDLRHAQTAAAQTVILHHPVLLEPAETIERVASALRKVATLV